MVDLLNLVRVYYLSKFSTGYCIHTSDVRTIVLEHAYRGFVFSKNTTRLDLHLAYSCTYNIITAALSQCYNIYICILINLYCSTRVQLLISSLLISSCNNIALRFLYTVHKQTIVPMCARLPSASVDAAACRILLLYCRSVLFARKRFI